MIVWGAVALLVLVIVTIIVCRWLAGAIREINKWERRGR